MYTEVSQNMHTCNNCDGFVTSDFVRVFGDESNTVYACPRCANMSDIMSGRGARTQTGEPVGG